MKTSNFKAHITGLKGFACFMIMLGHFLGVFAYSQKMPINLGLFMGIRDSEIGFLINEQYWLYLFFVISGYLLAFSRIESIQQLITKCVQRFLRLGLPIFFAYAIIFVVYKTLGFHNYETATLFQNSWYQNAYGDTYSLLTVIKSPIDVLILGRRYLNSPYWVLREMFFSSILIYLSNYFLFKVKEEKLYIRWIVILITLCCSFGISYFFYTKISIVCILGMVLFWIERDFCFLKDRQMFYIAVLLLCLAITVNVGNIRIPQVMFFMALIVFVPKIKFLNWILSGKLMLFVGKISFGIYSFHWPIYCSLGALVIIYTYSRIGLLSAILFGMTVSIIGTFLISWLYNISFERISNFLTKEVYLFLNRSFAKKISLSE